MSIDWYYANVRHDDGQFHWFPEASSYGNVWNVLRNDVIVTQIESIRCNKLFISVTVDDMVWTTSSSTATNLIVVPKQLQYHFFELEYTSGEKCCIKNKNLLRNVCEIGQDRTIIQKCMLWSFHPPVGVFVDCAQMTHVTSWLSCKIL